MKEHKHNNKSGAGIVLLQIHNNKICVLALKKEEYYDLPKGGLNPGETYMECMRRECWEESAITDIKVFNNVGTYSLGPIKIYMGTSKQSAHILPNPHTGIYEHSSAVWLPLKYAAFYFEPRLRSAIIWAKINVEDFGSNIINNIAMVDNDKKGVLDYDHINHFNKNINAISKKE